MYSLLPLECLIFLASSSDGVCSDTFTSGTVTEKKKKHTMSVKAEGEALICHLGYCAIGFKKTVQACVGLSLINYLLLGHWLLNAWFIRS